MELDFLRFFDACDPSKTLAIANPEDRQYYIDFASVRGGKIIEALARTISLRSRLNQPTCQLFTGHIGCGKSTELRRLQADLEAQGFHVVYFESTQDLDMADVDISDILLAIIRQVTESLAEVGIQLKPRYFADRWQEMVDFLQTPLELSAEANLPLPMKLGKITAKTKASPSLRSRLRQYLEPRTSGILESLNEEILARANQELQHQGKKGLVVIVDNLDRVEDRRNDGGRTQPEYLFVDRGEQLRRLNCHLVYTIPLTLMFSNDYQALTNRFGGGVAPRVLPMVSVRSRDGQDNQAGMALFRQLVLARAFPEIEPEARLDLVTQVFDSSETLDRLCRVSGGHVRNLLGIIYTCLQEEDTPLSRNTIERAIRNNRDRLVSAITDDEWELLADVVKQQNVSGEEGHDTLLRSLFVFEYQDEQGKWFAVNPVLRETEKFQRFCCK
ncbi:P-loop NTPase fold protein [Coleofasciculus sp. E1-EBD-02]|uniref:P-loop NTPase fold protein n=1 Tax=Coleofasciculus sp. E1-EBD-02 TaxID=3068481 RepID=UPI0032F1B071